MPAVDPSDSRFDWHHKVQVFTKEFRPECLVYVMPVLVKGNTPADVLDAVPPEFDRAFDQYRRVPKYGPRTEAEVAKGLPAHLKLD